MNTLVYCGWVFPHRRMKRTIGVFLFILFCSFIHLMIRQVFYKGSCPTIVWNSHSSPQNDNSAKIIEDPDVISCQNILMGDVYEIYKAKSFSGCTLFDYSEDDYYIEASKKCDDFLHRGGYLEHTITEDEKEFPIAFSILVYEQVHQMERMFRMIYRPQNVYCIHIDTSATPSTYTAVLSLAMCFPNVFVATRLVHVEYGMFSVLEAELNCVSDLLKHSIKWKYFINISGCEFPLQSNWELVKIFQTYNGSNDVYGSQKM